MINRYTPCRSLPLDNHGPVKNGRSGGGLVRLSFPRFQAHDGLTIFFLNVRLPTKRCKLLFSNYSTVMGGDSSRILSEYVSYRPVTSRAWLFGYSCLSSSRPAVVATGVCTAS
jgi:hypothetical protein